MSTLAAFISSVTLSGLPSLAEASNEGWTADKDPARTKTDAYLFPHHTQ
jgi:hypothetical protein